MQDKRLVYAMENLGKRQQKTTRMTTAFCGVAASSLISLTHQPNNPDRRMFPSGRKESLDEDVLSMASFLTAMKKDRISATLRPDENNPLKLSAEEHLHQQEARMIPPTQTYARKLSRYSPQVSHPSHPPVPFDQQRQHHHQHQEFTNSSFHPSNMATSTSALSSSRSGFIAAPRNGEGLSMVGLAGVGPPQPPRGTMVNSNNHHRESMPSTSQEGLFVCYQRMLAAGLLSHEERGHGFTAFLHALRQQQHVALTTRTPQQHSRLPPKISFNSDRALALDTALHSTSSLTQIGLAVGKHGNYPSMNLCSEVDTRSTSKNQEDRNITCLRTKKESTDAKTPNAFDIPIAATSNTATSQELQLRDLISARDRSITSKFTSHIIDQLDFVYFVEADRRSHRTHLPIGFRGFGCRYCHSAPGKSGRFFPSSLKTLSDTKKTLYALRAHLLKCPDTPDDVKQYLHYLFTTHLAEVKTLKVNSSQRAFFRKIWKCLRSSSEGDLAGDAERKIQPKK